MRADGWLMLLLPNTVCDPGPSCWRFALVGLVPLRARRPPLFGLFKASARVDGWPGSLIEQRP